MNNHRTHTKLTYIWSQGMVDKIAEKVANEKPSIADDIIKKVEEKVISQKPDKDPMGYPINKWNDGRIDHVEEERLADLARERQRERAQMEMFDDPYMNWSGHR